MDPCIRDHYNVYSNLINIIIKNIIPICIIVKFTTISKLNCTSRAVCISMMKYYYVLRTNDVILLENRIPSSNFSLDTKHFFHHE